MNALVRMVKHGWLRLAAWVTGRKGGPEARKADADRQKNIYPLW